MARASAAPPQVKSTPIPPLDNGFVVGDRLNLIELAGGELAGKAAPRYLQGAPEHTARSDVRMICGTFQCFRLVLFNA